MSTKGSSVFKFGLVLLFLLIAVSCSSAKPIPDTVDSISYHFEDSSVPPEYHRSYTITVTPSEATVVVDVYGDILAEERVAVSAETFTTIKTSFETNQIRSCRLPDFDGCTGGTGETIRYATGDERLFSAQTYHCGRDSGNLCGDIASFASDVKTLIPNLQELLNLPYAVEPTD